MDSWERWGLVTAAALPRAARRAPAPGIERVAHGLYRIGPRPSGDAGWWQDAAIACARRPDGVLHAQAAAATRPLDGFEPGVPITIAVPPGTSAREPGVHRLIRLCAPTTVLGLPVSGAAETLVDLGGELEPRPGCAAARTVLDQFELVELALECALHHHLTTLEDLHDALDAAGARRPGRAVLREVLRRRPTSAPPTESYLETRFVQLLRRADLPAFDRQISIHDDDGFIGRVDFRRERVVVEAVGGQAHVGKLHTDNERYARLAALGLIVIPLSFDHIEHRPHSVANLLRRSMAQGEA